MKKLGSLLLATFSLSLFAFSNSKLKGSWEMDLMIRSYDSNDSYHVIDENISFGDRIGNSAEINFEGGYFTNLTFRDSGKVEINNSISVNHYMPLGGSSSEILIGSDDDYRSFTVVSISKDQLILSRTFSCTDDKFRCPDVEGVKFVKESYYYKPSTLANDDELRVLQINRVSDKEVFGSSRPKSIDSSSSEGNQ
jgi:hypothetical protein